MSDNIPLEAQELIRRFNADQQRAGAGKATQRTPSETRELPRRNVTAKELLAEAAKLGCEIRAGGKHTKIIGPDKRKIGIPVHGGGHGDILATGTAITIDRWLANYRRTGVATPRSETPSQAPVLAARSRTGIK